VSTPARASVNAAARPAGPATEIEAGAARGGFGALPSNASGVSAPHFFAGGFAFRISAAAVFASA
jgi:hypothetical protein